jgi:hypothetical protein
MRRSVSPSLSRRAIALQALVLALVAMITATLAQPIVAQDNDVAEAPRRGAPIPIRFGFLWHMHQPNYYPYEPITQIAANGYYSFDVIDVHNSRVGPYTWWPYNAVNAGTGQPHLGAHVSFTGSLIENINVLRDAGVGGGMWNNWQQGYLQGIDLKTSLNNSRLDLVAFGYHHPLMPLLDERDIRMQIRLHKEVYGQTWNGRAYSKGMFPAENAFAERMIPALVAEGIDWVMVDNVHFDRACLNYPHTNASSLFAPNRADQLNPDPADNGGAWVQLNNVWAPSRVSAPFGYQPNWVQHVDPASGVATKMVAVPTARYEGNEDGRGGYGAFLYDTVMDAYLQYNTNAARPMLVLLHHDGDNYGGGTYSYYHDNFASMVSWVSGDPDYECTTVDDYLERFPVPADALIHVEPGSWAGADAGDPEFKKWLGDPNDAGWSPDRNSWAVMTAAKNRVYMADDLAPVGSIANVLSGDVAATATEKAWHFLLCGQASDYWYWDNSGEPWDSNVTRACNQAVVHADAAIAAAGSALDTTAPTIFVPQREPYNPGGYEWDSSPMPSDFEVWTYIDDVSGVSDVKLRWRTDKDGLNPLASVQNETFAGGDEVNEWQEIAMTAKPAPTRPGDILAPTYIATQYAATIADQDEVLIDYYVVATDGAGNEQRSDILHVWVGVSSTGGGGGNNDGRVTTSPSPLVQGSAATISFDPATGPLAGLTAGVQIHYGFDDWQAATITDAPMTWNATAARWEITLPMPEGRSMFDCVFHNGAGTWDNNNGGDWHLPVGVAATTASSGVLAR